MPKDREKSRSRSGSRKKGGSKRSYSSSYSSSSRSRSSSYSRHRRSRSRSDPRRERKSRFDQGPRKSKWSDKPPEGGVSSNDNAEAAQRLLQSMQMGMNQPDPQAPTFQSLFGGPGGGSSGAGGGIPEEVKAGVEILDNSAPKVDLSAITITLGNNVQKQNSTQEKQEDTKVRKKVFMPKGDNFNYTGLIIGPKGLNQKRLEDLTSCKILVRGKGSQKDSAVPQGDEDEEQHILIVGDSEMAVARANTEIENIIYADEPTRNKMKQEQLRLVQLLKTDPNALANYDINNLANPTSDQSLTTPYGPPSSDAFVLPIENIYVGLIIGKGGEKIRQIAQESGAKKVQMASDSQPGTNHRNLFVEGEEAHFERVKQIVSDLIESQKRLKQVMSGNIPDDPNVYKEDLAVPDNLVGLVIGKKGDTIRTINRTSGASVYIPKEAEAGKTERVLTITGTPAQVDVAKNMIMEKVNEGMQNMQQKQQQQQQNQMHNNYRNNNMGGGYHNNSYGGDRGGYENRYQGGHGGGGGYRGGNRYNNNDRYGGDDRGYNNYNRHNNYHRNDYHGGGGGGGGRGGYNNNNNDYNSGYQQYGNNNNSNNNNYGGGNNNNNNNDEQDPNLMYQQQMMGMMGYGGMNNNSGNDRMDPYTAMMMQQQLYAQQSQPVITDVNDNSTLPGQNYQQQNYYQQQQYGKQDGQGQGGNLSAGQTPGSNPN